MSDSSADKRHTEPTTDPKAFFEALARDEEGFRKAFEADVVEHPELVGILTRMVSSRIVQLTEEATEKARDNKVYLRELSEHFTKGGDRQLDKFYHSEDYEQMLPELEKEMEGQSLDSAERFFAFREFAKLPRKSPEEREKLFSVIKAFLYKERTQGHRSESRESAFQFFRQGMNTPFANHPKLMMISAIREKSDTEYANRNSKTMDLVLEHKVTKEVFGNYKHGIETFLMNLAFYKMFKKDQLKTYGIDDDDFFNGFKVEGDDVDKMKFECLQHYGDEFFLRFDKSRGQNVDISRKDIPDRLEKDLKRRLPYLFIDLLPAINAMAASEGKAFAAFDDAELESKFGLKRSPDGTVESVIRNSGDMNRLAKDEFQRTLLFKQESGQTEEKRKATEIVYGKTGYKDVPVELEKHAPLWHLLDLAKKMETGQENKNLIFAVLGLIRAVDDKFTKAQEVEESINKLNEMFETDEYKQLVELMRDYKKLKEQEKKVSKKRIGRERALTKLRDKLDAKYNEINKVRGDLYKIYSNHFRNLSNDFVPYLNADFEESDMKAGIKRQNLPALNEDLKEIKQGAVEYIKRHTKLADMLQTQVNKGAPLHKDQVVDIPDEQIKYFTAFEVKAE